MSGFFREHIVKPYLHEYDKSGKLLPARSPKWVKVRKLKIDAVGYCENCGKKIKFFRRWRLQVHHIKPFHLYPELELEGCNLMCLCSSPRCHLGMGHVGDWRAWNPTVREDCLYWFRKYRHRNYTRLS